MAAGCRCPISGTAEGGLVTLHGDITELKR
jgi:hypothetical protein